jgi:cytochrome c oxidase assembly protein subunit 15
MFALPVSIWFTGGVLQEHTHRLWASIVGTLVVALTRWLGGRKSRLPLALIGAGEIAAGTAMLHVGPDWKGAGYFLSGIGGMVLLASLVWFRAPALPRPLPTLGWWAFVLVQVQGLLGGLRVVLDSQMVAGARLGIVFGIFHGCLAQGFLAVLFVVTLLTSRWWQAGQGEPAPQPKPATLTTARLAFGVTALIFLQLMLGATMRHQHAGLAIPDFPLAYGRIWPAMDAGSVASYNAHRAEMIDANPITAFQIGLQMVHRFVALLIFAGVTGVAWKARKRPGIALRRLSYVWVGLILAQITLGAFTIWTNKAADIATLHVMVGSLSLVTGTLWCIIGFRRFEVQTREVPVTGGFGAPSGVTLAAGR